MPTLSLSYAAFAVDLTGRIVWNELCPGLHVLGQAKVGLDNGGLSAGITRNGTFTIPDVPIGTYVLSVQAHDYAFERLRIDVQDEESTPIVRPYIPGTPLSPPSNVKLPYPISLSARAKYDYYVPKESFNLIGMFQNPMMMIMLFTGVMVLAMPYLMKNMDPEMLQEFKERQAKITSIQSSLQSGDLKSGFTAIMNDLEGDKTASTSAGPQKQAPAPGVRNRGGKNRKR
ncbi:hypothetical protein NLI96_g11001 [Meripilus lineatus]|uniref:ER membrane protein complex subunit 7 beta-sandwich domain-containing protein n=1 Tax=Meripilus lineatus TaxID=2056292 RepID=A0AAD5UU16_9APHY|nr:hypothetical protein NLI96_g11001 [Physisporinus lineatus]